MMAKGVLTAAAAALMAGSVSAEPVNEPVRPAGQPVVQKAGVVLAAADVPQQVEARPVASDSATTAPARKRAARVTTCRCGESNGDR